MFLWKGIYSSDIKELGCICAEYLHEIELHIYVYSEINQKVMG